MPEDNLAELQASLSLRFCTKWARADFARAKRALRDFELRDVAADMLRRALRWRDKANRAAAVLAEVRG